MKHILKPSNVPRLRAFATSKVVLAFDFDGTLAPIVARPDAASMRRRTRMLLQTLASLYPCIVISGRARADLLARMESIPLRDTIGNHGAEPAARSRIPPQVFQWREVLASRLAGIAGLEIENKGFSLSVHYRRSRSPKRAHASILAVAEGLRGARCIGGKQVVNIVPANAPDKGTALEWASRRLGSEAMVYVGDDETDEDVFRRNMPIPLLSIRVGRSPESAAEFYVESQAEVNLLLFKILALGARHPHVAARRHPARQPRR